MRSLSNFQFLFISLHGKAGPPSYRHAPVKPTKVKGFELTDLGIKSKKKKKKTKPRVGYTL